MSRDDKVQYLLDHSNLGFNLAKKIKNDASQLDQYSDDRIDYYYQMTKESRSNGFSSVLIY